MAKIAKVAALEQPEGDPASLSNDADFVRKREKQEVDKAALQAAKKLRLSVRLQRGEARRRWEEAKKSIENSADIDYSNDVQLKGVFTKLLDAISNGEPTTISVPELPRLDITPDRREELAQSWTEQVAAARGAMSGDESVQGPRWTDRHKREEPAPALATGGSPLRLPDAVPEESKYKPRQGLVAFLEAGWPAPFIKAGLLSRPDLRRLDPGAAMALENWLKNPKHVLPDHLRVPKKAELVDRELEAIDPEQVRHAQRIASAARRRRQQAGI
jgi:hypothetical protein